MKIKLIHLLLPILPLTSCSTVRLRYSAEAASSSGKSGRVLFEKSYSVQDDKTWCLITGVFYGGWCWAYLGMPRDSQKRKMKADLEIALKEKFPKNEINLSDENYTRVSWDEKENEFDVTDLLSVTEKNKLDKETASAEAVKNNCAILQNEEMDTHAFISVDVGVHKLHCLGFEKEYEKSSYLPPVIAYPRIFINKKDSSSQLQIVFSYSGDDWMFANSFTYKIGSKLFGPFVLRKSDSNVHGRSVSEFLVGEITKENYVSFSKSGMKVRFSGKRANVDVIVPAQAFKDTYDLFNKSNFMRK